MAKKEGNFLGLSVRVRGDSRIKRRLAALGDITKTLLAKEHLQRLLLERTLARFEPAGKNRLAQKDPSGKAWKSVTDQTLYRRKRNRSRGSQALVASGRMRDAIKVISEQRRGLASASGGGFRIGINSTRIEKRARVHQFGAYTWNDRRIPQRRFLGVGKDDERAVDRLFNELAVTALETP